MSRRLICAALAVVTAVSLCTAVADANASCGSFGGLLCSEVKVKKVVKKTYVVPATPRPPRNSARPPQTARRPAAPATRSGGAIKQRTQVTPSAPAAPVIPYHLPRGNCLAATFDIGVTCAPVAPVAAPAAPRPAAPVAAAPGVPAPAPAAPAAPVVIVTTEELAYSAMASTPLPLPVPKRSPEQNLPDGRSTTFVKLPTWFYVPASQWVPVSVTAAAGGVSSTVTAVPSTLTFDPGNGDAAVSCSGPGRAWVQGQDGNLDPAPNGCGYTYRKTSYGHPGGMLTARYTITWKVTWSGSDGTSGVLPDQTTSSTATFAVAEAQAVVQ